MRWRPTGGAGGGRSLYTVEYRRVRRRRVVGWLLVAVGLVMGVLHVGTHLGTFSVLSPPGLQDLVMGYPAAALVVLAGVLLSVRGTRRR